MIRRSDRGGKVRIKLRQRSRRLRWPEAEGANSSYFIRPRQRRRRLRRRAVVCRLLVGISEPQQDRFAVRTAEERDADRQIVRGESRRHRHRGRIDQERVPGRYALVALIGRIDAVLDEGRLVLGRFVDDGVELVVRHYLENVEHQ